MSQSLLVYAALFAVLFAWFFAAAAVSCQICLMRAAKSADFMDMLFSVLACFAAPVLLLVMMAELMGKAPTIAMSRYSLLATVVIIEIAGLAAGALLAKLLISRNNRQP